MECYTDAKDLKPEFSGADEPSLTLPLSRLGTVAAISTYQNREQMQSVRAETLRVAVWPTLTP